MMKRIMSFLLVLIMVIGFLPMPTRAASSDTPMPKFYVKDPNSGILSNGVNSGDTYYIVFEDIYDKTSGEYLGNKPAYPDETPTDNYIKFHYNGTEKVFEITFKNVDYQRTSSTDYFLTVTENSGYSNAFDVVLMLEGYNKLSGPKTIFEFRNAGNVTITDNEDESDVDYTAISDPKDTDAVKYNLHVESLFQSTSFFWKQNAGNLIIKDTKIYYKNDFDGTGLRGGFCANGNIVIDGSVITMDSIKSNFLVSAPKYSSTPSDPTKSITVKNGSNITLHSSTTLVLTAGSLIFDNSNVNLSKSESIKPVFNRAPEIIGTYSFKAAGKLSANTSYPGGYNYEPGDDVVDRTDKMLCMFKIIHEHFPSDCTRDSRCACAQATVAKSADEHMLEYVNAQAATCTESGWGDYEYCLNCSYTTKVEIPATGEHTLVQVEAQAPTCGKAGWEAYEYCEVCEYTTYEEVVATGDHNMAQIAAKAPTCGEAGWEAHTGCSVCGYSEDKVEIPATGDHKIAYVDGKKATCAEPGWNAYEYCTACTTYTTKVEIPATGKIEVRPFYLLNGEVPNDLRTYMYEKPSFYTNAANFKDGNTVPTVSWSGAASIETLAAKLKAKFDTYPAGTRYFKLDAMSKALHSLVETNVFYDVAIKSVKDWVEAFLAEYYRIGGKLDGIQVDTEYKYGGSWYVHLAAHEKNDKSKYNDPEILEKIVADPRYKSEIRPLLEDLGFPFLESSTKTEINGIHTQYSDAYNIWNLVNSYRISKGVDEAVYEPLLKYYPNARSTDYQVRFVYGWQKAVMFTAGALKGNRIGLGSTSNFNAYSSRPTSSISGFGTTQEYSTPAAYNDAVYELTPFNTVLWEMNIFKDMYDATPLKRIAAHVTYFNYEPNKKGTYSNTPYYSESMYHIALMDPEPFMGYILDNEVFANGKYFNDAKYRDFHYILEVVDDLLKELTRVAGASDRKHIPIQSTWNSKFIISGMYSGGRNIWRITPDTSTGVTLEQFKVKDQAPTFYINGQTIIFPQGRIIEDGKIREVGTCGYWVETPADVKPIIINDENRYSKYPSYSENFDSYTAGTEFTSESGKHKATWEVTGTGASVQLHNSDNALAMTGTTTVKSVKLPRNITAGDNYAKQQVWEVTVTVPASGELKLLNYTDADPGVKISGGKVYYASGTSYQQLSGVTLSAGSTYIIRRELDFRTTNAFKASYTVYDANGNRLGGVSDVSIAPFADKQTKVSYIGISCSDITGTAYIDDFKMYPTGVTTDFEIYDAGNGFKDTSGKTRTADTAYRLSWMNASSEYKVAKVLNNGVVVEEIKMAPGQDGVNTGVVKGDNINLSVITEDGSAPATDLPDYSSGDFDWTAPAELIGLASGKSDGKNLDPNSEKYVIVHNLVSVDEKDPNCNEFGYDAYEYCKDCDYTTKVEKPLDKDNHIAVIQVEAKDPTCTEVGWYAHEYCTGCDYTTYVEKPALGHDKSYHDAKAPTCTDIGWDAYEDCSRCDYSTYVERPALGHDTIYHDAKIPTHNEIGWNAYETCGRCDYSTYVEIGAAVPLIKIHTPTKSFEKYIEVGKDYFVTFTEDETNGSIPALFDNKPGSGGYIQFHYVSDGGKPVLQITIDSVSYVSAIDKKDINYNLLSVIDKQDDSYSNAFDVVITLKDDSTFDGHRAGISVNNMGRLTLTGNGSLTINSREVSKKTFEKNGTGPLYISNTRLNINHKSSSSGLVYGLYATEDIFIEGSVVNIISTRGSYLLRSYSGKVTIKNSDFFAQSPSGGNPVISSNQPVVFENSNVTLKKSSGHKGHCLSMAPDIVGSYSEQLYIKGTVSTSSVPKDYTALNHKAGDAWAGGTYASTSYNYFQLVHQCIALPDDDNCVTPIKCECGRIVEEGKDHTPSDAVIENETAEAYDSVVYCSVCHNVVSRTTICKHTKTEIQNAKPATCTETGLTEGKKCTVCGEITVAQTVIDALGHTEETIPGKDATCTETGLTEGKKCSVCDEITVAQEVIPAKLRFELNSDGESYSVTDCDQSISGEVVIPATYEGLPVTSIGKYAFDDCAGLTSVTIPDSVTSIGEYAFDDCESLTKVCISDIATWCQIDFNYDNPLFYAHNLYLNGKLVEDIVIPDGVTSINNYAFWCCDSLTSITIPDSVTSIGVCAFEGCTSLTSVTIPNSVTSIGIGAFCGCTSLTSVIIPDGVSSIGVQAFAYCDYFTSIVIPGSVTHIDGGAFMYTDLGKVIYCGTQEQWNNIRIGTDNGTLYEATLQFHNPGAAADCANDQICTICNKVLVEKGHTEEIIPGKDASCTETGLTEGKKCSVCGEIIVAQEEIPANGHDYNKAVTAPTCTEQGYTTYTCACGDTYKDNYVDATGHSYTSEVTKAPTCVDKGEKTFTCACGDTYTQEIAAKGHTLTQVEAKAPTCTEAGYEAYEYCSECDYTTFNAVEATGHKYETEVTKPTCTEKGYTTYTCACGDTYSQEIAAKGHTEETIPGKAATCTETGLTEGKKCSVCGTILKGQEVIKAAGHKYEAVVTAPTFEAMGYTIHTCSVCTDSYTDNYVDALIAVATADSVKFETLQAAMNVGGIVKLLANIETDAAILVSKTVVLDLNGFNVKTTENDTAGDGVFHVVVGGELTINGEGTINGVGGNDYNIAIWADGGKVIINGGTYTNFGATGKEDDHFDLIYVKNGGIVEIYGGKFIAQTPAWTLNSHDSKVGTIKVFGGEFVGFDPANNNAEGKNTNFLADKFKHTKCVENVYTICEDTHKATVTAPTCTEQGYTTYTCHCGDTYVADYVDATGHSYTSEVTKEPTCVDKGEKTFACACGDTYTVEIAAKGHTEVIDKAVAPTCTATGLTEGKHCDVCGKVLVAQEEIPANGHIAGNTFVDEDSRVEATLNNKGSYDVVVYCSACGKEISRETVYTPALTGAVAKVKDGDMYASLQEAIDAAIANTEEKTVVLLKNVINAPALVINSGKVTIDFNGFFYEVSETTNGAALYIGKDVVVSLINDGAKDTDSRLAIKYAAYQKFDCLVKNEGVLNVSNIRLNGANLYKAGAATIVNSGAVCLEAGTLVTVNKTTNTGLKNSGTGTVTKAAEVKLEAVDGYHWENETSLTAHNQAERIENNKPATLNNKGSYDVVVYCSVCGKEISRKTVYTPALTSVVAKIKDGDMYASLQEAIDAAIANTEEKTVVLLKNVINAQALVINSVKVTIDFNGFFYEVSETTNGAALYVGKDAVVSLINDGAKDTDSRLAIKYAAYQKFDCLVKNEGVLTVSSIRLNGANLYKTGAAAIVNSGAVCLEAGTLVTVNMTTNIGLKNNGTGTVTKAAEVKLEPVDGYHWENETSMIAHDQAERIENNKPATLNNKGSYDVVVYCSVCGKEISRKTIYTPALTSVVAKIEGGDMYASLQEAVDAAKENDVVVLLRDVFDGTTLVVSNNARINLNGKTYSVKNVTGAAALVIKNNAEVEIYGGTLRADYSAWDKFDSLVKVESGKLVVKDATLNANNVLKAGAAVFANDGTVELTNVTVNKKAAEYKGNAPVVQ